MLNLLLRLSLLNLYLFSCWNVALSLPQSDGSNTGIKKSLKIKPATDECSGSTMSILCTKEISGECNTSTTNSAVCECSCEITGVPPSPLPTCPSICATSITGCGSTAYRVSYNKSDLSQECSVEIGCNASPEPSTMIFKCSKLFSAGASAGSTMQSEY